MKDLDAKFARMRTEVDRDKVTNSMRKEALAPTRDAIKVCIQLRNLIASISYIVRIQTFSMYLFILEQIVPFTHKMCF